MEIIIILALIVLNGFFALSEIALVSSKKSRLEQLQNEGSNGAKTALQLLCHSEDFLSSIQVGITLIGIITGVYGGMNIADDVAPLFEKIAFIQNYAHEIALFITVITITYVSIVIGELVPKTIALSKPEKIATIVAPIIFYFSKIFHPFVKVLSASTNFINKIIGVKKQTENITESELRQIIKTASAEGIIEKEQNIIHEKIFTFSDKKAKHLMTHRTDVEWIDIETPFEKIKEELLNMHHIKIVCCKSQLENFQGVLMLNDFYKMMATTSDFSISDLMIPPTIVPESANAQSVLDILRKDKTHICFVVNEYGGFEGIITLRDIMENIVGHIVDDESPESDIFVREDQSILINGTAPIESIEDIIEGFEIDFEQIDYSTVAGFVLQKINKAPQIGDSFEFMDYHFEIVDIDGNRIDKVLILKT